MSVAYGQITLSEINDGVNTATIYLYQRNANTPTKPQDPLTYTFATKTLSGGSLGDWSTQVPDGTTPCWIIVATASSVEDTDTIASSQWTTPIVFAKNGENGGPGLSGYNTATVQLYRRSATQPKSTEMPQSTITYTFSSGALSSIPNGWERSLPESTTSNSNPCWMIMVSLISQGTSVNIDPNSWTSPVKIVENGQHGVNTATINLYQRAESQPTSKPSGITYTFATHALSGNLGDWEISVPDGSNPCWMISTTVSSTADTVNITDWTDPVKLVENGQPGPTGPSASMYYLRVSHAAVARTENGSYKPGSITLNAEIHTGTASPLSYSGNIVIETSVDNQNWIEQTRIASDSLSYTIPSNLSTIVAIRCSLYMSGNNSSVLLDQHIIPVIEEGYTTTAAEALKRATAIYGVCQTSAGVLEKTVDIADFELYKGAQITVLFKYGNTAGNPTSTPPVYPTLNVNSTGAKQIQATSVSATTGLTPLTGADDTRNWVDNSLVNFLYDEDANGANGRWIIVDSAALTKIDNILTKVIAGQHGKIDMTNGNFIFYHDKNDQTHNAIAYDSTSGVLSMTGKIVASSGTIGGFTIGDTAIFNNKTSLSANTDGVYLGTDGIALGKGLFKVTPAGKLYSTSAEIGGFEVTSDQIRKVVDVDTKTYKACINAPATVTNSTKAFFVRVSDVGSTDYNYPFYVTYNGKLYSTSAEIGGFTVDTDSIRVNEKTDTTNGSITISSTNFSRDINSVSRSNLRFAIGKNFGITNAGVLYATSANITGTINANDGTLGNMTVTGTLQGSSVVVQSTEKTDTSAGFKVLDSTGAAVFSVLPNGPITTGFTYKTRFYENVYADKTIYASGSLKSPVLNANSLQITDVLIGSVLPTTYATINSNGIYTGSKTSVTDGVTGGVLHTNGNLYLTSDTNPYIRFMVNSATSTSHSIHANANAVQVDGSQFSPYYAGQTVTLVTGNMDFPAHITTSSTAIIIGIPTRLSMSDISDITVSSFNITLRHVGGGSPYHGTTQISGVSSLPSGLTWSAAKAGPNMIRLTLTSSSGFVTTSGGSTKVTNNTPIAASFSDLKVTFS